MVIQCAHKIADDEDDILMAACAEYGEDTEIPDPLPETPVGFYYVEF